MLTIIILLFTALTISAQTVGTVNRVLMVDEYDRINVSNVLVTTAQLSSNMVATAVAVAKADAARSAALDASNMVDQVVADIAANELVIYRVGYTDSFSSDIQLPPGTKCLITKFTPSVATSSDGRDVHEISYSTTYDCSGIAPDILAASTLTGGSTNSWDNFTPLSPSDVSAPVATGEAFTTSDGTLYPYSYKVRVTTPQSPAGFYCVYLSGDATGSGAVLEIAGGVSGGKSATVEWGGHKLTFTGGLLTGVEEVAQ